MKSKYFATGADIPKRVKSRTYENMKVYRMGLYDAFKEAIEHWYDECPVELQEAWYTDNFRAYIPSAYIW